MAGALALPSNLRLCEVCPPDFEAEHAEIPTCDAESYWPLPYQDKFHNLESTTKGMIGGIGIGKTTIGAREAFDNMFGDNPEPHIGIIGAPTFAMLRDSVLPAIQRVFPPDVYAGGRWDTGFAKSEMILTMVNGSKIVFRSLDRDNFHKLRGIEAAWGWIDEARLLATREPWDVLLGRLRQVARRRSAWITTTPNGEDWVADMWVRNPEAGYEYIHARSVDNPYLPPDFFERIRAAYGEEFLRQELDGEILSAHGAVFKRLKQLLWPHGNVLLYNPIKRSTADLAIDFGYRRPSAQLIQTVRVSDAEGKETELDCIIWELTTESGGPPEDMTIHQVAAAVKASGFKVGRVFGDPSGDSANDQTHISSARTLCKVLGIDRFIKPKKPWQRSKQNGEETVRGRIQPSEGPRRLVWAGSKVLDKMGRPHVLAPHSLRSHRNLRYPVHKPGRKQPSVSEKDGVNDHDTDAVRYHQVMCWGNEAMFHGIASRPSFAKY